MLKKLLLSIAILVAAAPFVLYAMVIHGVIDIPLLSACGTPATGYGRLCVSSATSLLTCTLNGGTSCMPPSPVFQTNGTNNATQSTLNLVAGSNVTLTNSGSSVTIASSGGGGGGGLAQLAQQVFGGSSSNYTFTSVNQSYSNLEIDASGCKSAASGTGGDGLQMQFNSDTTAGHYAITQFIFYNNGSTAATGAQLGGSLTSTALIPSMPTAGFSSSDLASGISVFNGYSVTKATHESMSSTSTFGFAGSDVARADQFAGYWRPSSASAITSIKVFSSSGSNLNSGCTVTLYGKQ